MSPRIHAGIDIVISGAEGDGAYHRARGNVDNARRGVPRVIDQSAADRSVLDHPRRGDSKGHTHTVNWRKRGEGRLLPPPGRTGAGPSLWAAAGGRAAP